MNCRQLQSGAGEGKSCSEMTKTAVDANAEKQPYYILNFMKGGHIIIPSGLDTVESDAVGNFHNSKLYPKSTIYIYILII